MYTEFYIDGYNLLLRHGLKRLPGGPRGLERARAAMLAWLARRMTPPVHATVVFDSNVPQLGRRPRGEYQQEMAHGLRVLYATGHPTADALILDLVRRHDVPGRLIVVSNDRDIQYSARKLRAKSIGCDVFLDEYAVGPGRAEARKRAKPTVKPPADVPMEKRDGPSPAEIELWMAAFRGPIDDDPPPVKRAPVKPPPRPPSTTPPAAPPKKPNLKPPVEPPPKSRPAKKASLPPPKPPVESFDGLELNEFIAKMTADWPDDD
ncbi:MAG: NYN domain-containing protein [Planctomycetia bacterium]